LEASIAAVALPGVDFPRERQRIEDLAMVGYLRPGVFHQAEFVIEEADIKVRVVNDELGVFHKVEKLVDDFVETGFGLELGAADAVHRDGAFIDVTVRIQKTVKLAARQAAIDHFEATDLDDAVALGRGKARGYLESSLR
jgi:hypothetical protein